MTDMRKLIERMSELQDGNAWPSTIELMNDLADALVAALEREEKLMEALEADCTSFQAMEAKLIEVANRISGMRGQPPCHPDPVMLSEWVAEINRAALSENSQ